MCGIAGFINLDRAPADAQVLARMTDLVRHRGPDDRGVTLFSITNGTAHEVSAGSPAVADAGEGGVGFQRLKILDLSEHGHQPMMNADRTVMIAFNGEIYNAFDFTPELESAGFRFRSRSDTEVILYLYERYGLDGMLERLNGMFAIVIADFRSHELHVIRDHFGIKPMYWTVAGSSLLFASEAKAFLASLPEVASVEYVSPAQALDRFISKHRNDPLARQALELLGSNPFGAALVVRAHSL